jgi:hypothetical protein
MVKNSDMPQKWAKKAKWPTNASPPKKYTTQLWFQLSGLLGMTSVFK